MSPNKIDVDFQNLVTFLEDRSEDEIFASIKQNWNYLKTSNPRMYTNIINFYNEHKLWGTIDLDKNDYTLISSNAHFLSNYLDRYKWLYDNLADYRSKKILTRVLTFWLMIDHKNIPSLIDANFEQYFDLDIIKCTKDEVFVDIGSYIGDTLVSYIKNYGKDNHQKIYCYEIVPENIKYLEANIDLLQVKQVEIRKKGVSNKAGKLYFSGDEVSSVKKLSTKGEIEVDTVTIDDDIDEKVTFIKMDIEGAEDLALEGCLKTIQKHHPKLAICVYHNNEHLWKFAKMIHDIDPSYKFYLRYYGGPILPTEYVLYAI